MQMQKKMTLILKWIIKWTDKWNKYNNDNNDEVKQEWTVGLDYSTSETVAR